jgi:putative ABC transport system permease protein
MLKNYLLIAWRNLLKNKTFSLINITGLAIGLACFLLIALFVLDELSYDKFNEKADRIYRINARIRFGGADLNFPLSSDMMGQSLKQDYPQVENYVRIYNSNGSKLIKKGNEYINEFKVAHADSTLFEVFTLPVIQGDPRTALNGPDKVVITEKMARKYFGTTDAVGKSLETNDNNRTVYKVTAVIKNIPQNSHFNFDFFFSMKNANYQWGQYLSHNFHTYLLLKNGTNPKIFDKYFLEYEDKYVLPQIKFMGIKSLDEFRKAGNILEYSMMPLTQIHLYSDRQYEFLPPGNIQYVYIFSGVALFILLIACINFMNLTTARSIKRSKEVGIRKVLGTDRKDLIAQFLMESTLMVLLSMIIAIGLARLVLPLFNDVAGKSMTLVSLFSPLLLPLLIALPFIVGLLAGSYPAFFLSGFRPIEVLKGKIKLGGKNGGLRSGLVIFQFFASIVLIIGTIIIYRQLNFIQTTNIGFNRDQVLIVNGTYVLDNNAVAFKNDITRLPGVQSGTLSSFLPVSSSSRNDNIFARAAVMDVKNGFDMQVWQVDYDYLKTLGMQLVKGRNFSKDFGSDSSAVVINETTAKFLGYNDPIGQKLYGIDKTTTAYNIIGVVKNFNFESLKQTVGPLGLFLGQSNGLASFKVNAASIPEIVKEVESKWKTLAPGIPYNYRFLDASFNDMYKDEQRVGKIVLIFSVLAICIACLGLFGLSTFIAEQRTKEIGIRKVLGATVRSIVQLVSKEFMILVGIAFIIAVPVAWWAMNKWLTDFVYRVSIEWWVFVLAGGIALGIALATMSYQAIKAAMMNPTKSLRSE